jgi:hypothetical protein
LALGRPAKDVLAATSGMPEDPVSLCLFGQIKLIDGERGIGPQPRSSPLWRKARSPRPPTIRPKDGRRQWQAGPEPPHSQADAPACRSISRRNWSAPDEFGPDHVGWHGWPKTIASNAQAPPSTERGPGSNVVLRAFLA